MEPDEISRAEAGDAGGDLEDPFGPQGRNEIPGAVGGDLRHDAFPPFRNDPGGSELLADAPVGRLPGQREVDRLGQIFPRSARLEEERLDEHRHVHHHRHRVPGQADDDAPRGTPADVERFSRFHGHLVQNLFHPALREALRDDVHLAFGDASREDEDVVGQPFPDPLPDALRVVRHDSPVVNLPCPETRQRRADEMGVAVPDHGAFRRLPRFLQFAPGRQDGHGGPFEDGDFPLPDGGEGGDVAGEQNGAGRDEDLPLAGVVPLRGDVLPPPGFFGEPDGPIRAGLRLLDLDHGVEGRRHGGTGHDLDAIPVPAFAAPAGPGVDGSDHPVRGSIFLAGPHDGEAVHRRPGKRGDVPVRGDIARQDFPPCLGEGYAPGLPRGTDERGGPGDAAFEGSVQGVPPFGIETKTIDEYFLHQAFTKMTSSFNRQIKFLFGHNTLI